MTLKMIEHMRRVYMNSIPDSIKNLPDDQIYIPRYDQDSIISSYAIYRIHGKISEYTDAKYIGYSEIASMNMYSVVSKTFYGFHSAMIGDEDLLLEHLSTVDAKKR